MNKNKLIVLSVSAVSVVTCALIGLIPTKNNNDNKDYDMVISTSNENNDFNLNATEIKLKDIGDTFILSATLNEDATFKKVIFTSSDEEAISITPYGDSSCRLTKLKDFYDYVEITAVSNDPFVDVEATCLVRCYNKMININGDLSWTAEYNGQTFKSEKDDTFYLIKGAKYECVWPTYSTFSQMYSDDHPDTYYDIEDQDFEALKQMTQGIWGENEIISFTQYFDEGLNMIEYSFIYEHEISFVPGEYNNYYLSDDLCRQLFFYNYVAVTSLELPEDDIVL